MINFDRKSLFKVIATKPNAVQGLFVFKSEFNTELKI